MSPATVNRKRQRQWPVEAYRKGFTPKNSYLKGTKSGRTDRRPPLAYINYVWTQDGNGVIFNSGGAVYLMTGFPRGSSEDQRHTGETLTYKIDIHLNISILDNYMTYVNRARNVVWLVYDVHPQGTLPKMQDIFNVIPGCTNKPEVWKVNRDVKSRFIVKRRWVFITETNGVSALKANEPCNPCASQVYFNKFVKRLGVRTEWKNTATGDIGDISKGALYLCIAPGNNMSFAARGGITVYFKSVGNQ
ncbi:capsid protein [Brachypodium phoenicoides associated virus 1]|nr:capsid protein [Brachypodium phoenicoides associated virus 1]